MDKDISEKILAIKNKIGNIILLMNEIENIKREGKEIISQSKVENHFFPSKMNKEKINNTLNIQFVDDEYCYSIGNIVNIIENDLIHYKKIENFI